MNTLKTIVVEAEDGSQIPVLIYSENDEPNISESYISNCSTSSTSYTDSQQETVKWTTNSIKLLIHTKFELESEFANPKTQKIKIWGKVAEVLRHNGYTTISGMDCSNKWKNLLVTYTRNIDKMHKTGESKITWEHFHQLHEVLGNKNSINPPKEHLIDTLSAPTNSEESSDGSNEYEDDSVENVEIANGKKRKRTTNDSLKTFLKSIFHSRLEYEQQRDKEEKEIEDKRWKAKVTLEQAKIEAIKELTQAINNSSKE